MQRAVRAQHARRASRRTVVLVAQALYEAAGQGEHAAERGKALRHGAGQAGRRRARAERACVSGCAARSGRARKCLRAFAEVKPSVRAAAHRPCPLCRMALPPVAAAPCRVRAGTPPRAGRRRSSGQRTKPEHRAERAAADARHGRVQTAGQQGLLRRGCARRQQLLMLLLRGRGPVSRVRGLRQCFAIMLALRPSTPAALVRR